MIYENTPMNAVVDIFHSGVCADDVPRVINALDTLSSRDQLPLALKLIKAVNSYDLAAKITYPLARWMISAGRDNAQHELAMIGFIMDYAREQFFAEKRQRKMFVLKSDFSDPMLHAAHLAVEQGGQPDPAPPNVTLDQDGLDIANLLLDKNAIAERMAVLLPKDRLTQLAGEDTLIIL